MKWFWVKIDYFIDYSSKYGIIDKNIIGGIDDKHADN
jgi:hypothetical protein